VYHRQLKLAAPVYLTKGVPVGVVMSSTGTCFVNQAPPNYGYAYGDAYTGAPGSWTPIGTADPTRPDIPFETIMDDGGRLAFMTAGRISHTATRLSAGPRAGLILLAGGYPQTTQFYNPTAVAISGVEPGRFADGPSLLTARSLHTATLLPDGWVLVAGGIASNGGAPLATTELYDPTTNTFVEGPLMLHHHYVHTATVVTNGVLLQVLIVGGHESDWYSLPLQGTDLLTYDLSTHTGSFAFGPSLTEGRADHAAVRLADGRVLVTGGWGAAYGELIDIYAPGAQVAVTHGAMQQSRVSHTATLLQTGSQEGQVLIAGGYWWDGTGRYDLPAELFDPAAGTFAAVGTRPPRARHAAATLADGRVLLAGGRSDPDTPVSSMEVYDPVTGKFVTGADMTVARADLTATVVLPDASVLLAGGSGSSQASSVSAEVYRPAEAIWPAGVVGATYGATIAGFGTAPNWFTILSGSLPDGLALDQATGVVSGGPAVSGVFRLVVEIADSSAPPRKVLRTVTIQINPTP
jgi:hypothetical protein